MDMVMTAAMASGDATPAFEDPEFPADDSSLGPSAEVSVTFSGGSGPDRKVSVPVLWRLPHSLADENGNFGPDAAVDPLAELVAYRPFPPSAGAAAAAASSRSSSSVYKAPNAADIAYLTEQLSRKFGSAAKSKAAVPKVGRPWVFKQGRYQCEDVAQGQLGVCWFVSALSLVAQREELIGRLFPAGPLLDAIRAAGELVPPHAEAAVAAGDHAAATAALAPATVPLHPRNMYQVRLCVDGLWRVVTVDGRIPAHSYTGKVCYSSSLRRQAWVPIVEKAAAKVVGSYGGLASGTVGEALRLLTGAPVMSLYLRTDESEDQRSQRHSDEWKEAEAAADAGVSAGAGGRAGPRSGVSSSCPWELDLGSAPPESVLERLWVRLLSWHEAGFLMGASCSCPEAYTSHVARAVPDVAVWAALVESHKDTVRRLGLHMNHAYSLLQVLQDPAGGKARLVQIRNPHASGRRSSDGGPPNSWAGAWSDGAPEWAASPALRDACGPHFQEETGVFWMSLEDFATYFHRIDVAMVRASPQASRTGSSAPSSSASADGRAPARGGAGAGAGAAAMPPARAAPPTAAGGAVPSAAAAPAPVPAWSVVRARLPLPSAQQGVYSLRVVPLAPDGAATEVDVVVTDTPSRSGSGSAAAASGAGAAMAGSSSRGDIRCRRRRADEARALHDLAALVVEELPRGAAAALAAARSAALDERESRVGAGRGAGAAGAAAHVDSHGQPTGPKDQRGEILALEASGMRYVTGGKRSLEWEVTASAFLDARPILPPSSSKGPARGEGLRATSADGGASLQQRVYHILPFSLNSYALASDGPSFAVVEVHHATNRPLRIDVVAHPARAGVASGAGGGMGVGAGQADGTADGAGFFARAVMCRALTLGDAMVWDKDRDRASTRGVDDTRYSGLVLVTHGDGAGKVIVAANRSPTDAVQIKHEFSASTTWDCVAVSRPSPAGLPHASEDVIAPLTVQVLQTLSQRPLPEGREQWSWGSRLSTSSGGRIGSDGAPPHSPPITEAATGGGALHVQLPFVVR